MPVAKHTIVFARIVPSELNIVTTENNNVIDLAFTRQIKDSNGNDIWQMKENDAVDLSWNEFVYHFYGGGEKDFGISQLAGRQMTMIGISGEYANGVPQASSSITHLADRARTDSNGTTCRISGVSILNDVIDSIVLDLGLPHEAWDSCSYMNVVNQLQDVHTLQDVTQIQGKLQKTCSLSMASLVHEIASNYDESMGYNADDELNSAVRALYNHGLDRAINMAMGGRYLVGSGTRHADNAEFEDTFTATTAAKTGQEIPSLTLPANHGIKKVDFFKLKWMGEAPGAGDSNALGTDKILDGEKTAIEAATCMVYNVGGSDDDDEWAAGGVALLRKSDGTALDTLDRSNGGTTEELNLANGWKMVTIGTLGGDLAQVDQTTDANQLHMLGLSIMFKNSTPGVRNIEFRIHFKVGMSHGNNALEDLCIESRNPTNFALDGTQT